MLHDLAIAFSWLLFFADVVILLRAMLRPQREPASRIAWVIAILVLPLLGSSTVRDTAALPVDFYVGDLVDQVDDMGVRNSLYGLRIINTRANLLGTTSVIDTAPLRSYSFTRDAYLQLRSGAKAGAGADEGKLPEDY